MKYIKGYKIFESKAISLENIMNEINDILLEVSDIDKYYTSCEIMNDDIRVIVENVDMIKLEDVKDCINRILDYLISKDFVIKIHSEDIWYDRIITKTIYEFEHIEDIIPWENYIVGSVVINFVKKS